MLCVEYKKILSDTGRMQNPPWIVEGEYFYDPGTKTYIGFVLAESEREYFIPDTVVELSEDQFVARCIALHGSHPEYFSTVTEPEEGAEDRTRTTKVATKTTATTNLTKFYKDRIAL